MQSAVQHCTQGSPLVACPVMNSRLCSYLPLQHCISPLLIRLAARLSPRANQKTCRKGATDIIQFRLRSELHDFALIIRLGTQCGQKCHATSRYHCRRQPDPLPLTSFISSQFSNLSPLEYSTMIIMERLLDRDQHVMTLNNNRVIYQYHTVRISAI